MTGHASTLRVATAIIRQKETILAAQRDRGPMAGCWEFPSSGVEEGESPETALRRGMREELGCSLATMWPLDVVEYDCPDFHLSMDCYVCTLAEGEDPVARRHRELRWLGAGELLDVEWLPADRALVTELGMGWSEIFSEGRF